MNARRTRQHEQTRIVFTATPEKDARKRQQVLGGTVKQVRLRGETVWCVALGNGTYNAFLCHEQGRKIGLCMYRECPRKIEECRFHKNSRKELPGQDHRQG